MPLALEVSYWGHLPGRWCKWLAQLNYCPLGATEVPQAGQHIAAFGFWLGVFLPLIIF